MAQSNERSWLAMIWVALIYGFFCSAPVDLVLVAFRNYDLPFLLVMTPACLLATGTLVSVCSVETILERWLRKRADKTFPFLMGFVMTLALLVNVFLLGIVTWIPLATAAENRYYFLWVYGLTSLFFLLPINVLQKQSRLEILIQGRVAAHAQKAAFYQSVAIVLLVMVLGMGAWIVLSYVTAPPSRFMW